jgi:hypothetical protein
MTEHPVHVPELPSEEARDRLAGLVDPFLRVTQPKIYGIENIGDSGVLLVGNHTIYGFLDLPLMMAELWKRDRVTVRGLGEHAHYAIPVWRDVLAMCGMVRGTRDNVRALMRDKQNVLVFPGGAREVNKRKGETYQLMWKERLGFARLAIEHAAPRSSSSRSGRCSRSSAASASHRSPAPSACTSGSASRSRPPDASPRTCATTSRPRSKAASPSARRTRERSAPRPPGPAAPPAGRMTPALVADVERWRVPTQTGLAAGLSWWIATAVAEVARFVPVRRRAREPVARLDAGAVPLDHAIRNTRVIARSALVLVPADRAIRDECAAAIALLGDAVRRLDPTSTTGATDTIRPGERPSGLPRSTPRARVPRSARSPPPAAASRMTSRGRRHPGTGTRRPIPQLRAFRAVRDCCAES